MTKTEALEALQSAYNAAALAENARDLAAIAAREAGATWNEVGTYLAITKQRAQQRYSGAERERIERTAAAIAKGHAQAAEILEEIRQKVWVQPSTKIDVPAPATAATTSIFLEPKAPAQPEVTTITGITVGPPHVQEWPHEVRKTKAKKPSSRVAAPGELPTWNPTTDAKPEMIDRRPRFHLESAGMKDGVAQPGTGKGPHACKRCGSTNHKSGDPDLVHAYPGECQPTKYDPRDIADWLTSQPAT